MKYRSSWSGASTRDFSNSLRSSGRLSKKSWAAKTRWICSLHEPVPPDGASSVRIQFRPPERLRNTKAPGLIIPMPSRSKYASHSSNRRPYSSVLSATDSWSQLAA